MEDLIWYKWAKHFDVDVIGFFPSTVLTKIVSRFKKQKQGINIHEKMVLITFALSVCEQ